MRQYYNYETMFQGIAEALKSFCNIDLGVYAEVSGVGGGYHFEILANEDEAKRINAFLDSIQEV